MRKGRSNCLRAELPSVSFLPGACESGVVMIARRWLPSLLLCTLVTIIGACGRSPLTPSLGGGGGSHSSSTDTKTASGVTQSKRIPDLTVAEQEQVCDWMAAKSGGYGHTSDCNDGTTGVAYPNRAACVGDFFYAASLGSPFCTATVKQLEDCVNQVGTCQAGSDAATMCEALLSC